MTAITAPPGSGKSFLALFLSMILHNRKVDQDQIAKILEHQNPSYVKKIKEPLTNWQKSQGMLLPVPLVGDMGSLKKSLIVGLLNAMRLWIPRESIESEWILALKDLPGAPARNRNPENLPERIGEFFEETEDFFPAYERLIELLKLWGYTGVFFIHDEFNRFLSRAAIAQTNTDLDFLQDFAERNLRWKHFTVLHYLLLHKGISQYLGGISEERRKDWLKIEGRFYPVHYQEDAIDIYSLFVSFFKKSVKKKLRPTEIETIQNDVKWAKKANPELDKTLHGLEFELGLECHPLHLSAILAVPLLSSLIGQNERSLFSELNTVFKRDAKSWIRVPELYDTFDGKIDSLSAEDPVRSKWNAGRNAISEVTEKSEKDFLKILTVYSVLQNHILLPSTLDWIAYSLGLEKKSAKQILNSLVERNFAIYKETTHTYQIFYGSSVQVGSKIANRMGQVTSEDMQSTIDKRFPIPPIYSNRFNAIHFTSHFYSRFYLLESRLSQEIQFRAETGARVENGLEFQPESNPVMEYLLEVFQYYRRQGSIGVVIYFLGDKNSYIGKLLKRTILTHPDAEPFLLVFPKESYTESLFIKKYVSALALQKDAQFLKSDPFIETDLKIHLSDLQEKIRIGLSQYFQEESWELHLPEKFLEIRNSQEKDVVSQILETRYSATPKINSELINRESITPPIRNARKKLLREMLAASPTLGTQTNGYGPDVAIFRSLFTAKNLIQRQTNHWKWNFQKPLDVFGNPDTGLKQALQSLKKLFHQKRETYSLQEIYQLLQSPPFGFYSEVIPFYLLAVLLEGNFAFSLYQDGRYEKDLNSDVLEKIHLQPESYTLKILEKIPVFDLYLKEIALLFEKENIASSLSSPTDPKKLDNLIYRSTLSILYWYNRLPEYTKRSKDHSVQAREFLDTVSHAKDPETFLLKNMPEIFTAPLKELGEQKLPDLILQILATKDSIEAHYVTLIQETIASTRKVLQSYIPAEKDSKQDSPNPELETNSLVHLTKIFLERNSFRLEVLANQDKDFLKFLDRLKMPYATDPALVESLASLITDTHPKFWKDNTRSEYEFKLTRELSKLHIAGILAGNQSSGHYIAIQHVLEVSKTWSEEEKEFLIRELMKEK